MGEVVVSSEELGVSNMEAETKMKWERFLPRMNLRVLLVEADDSTRQIISVLLRKCSYKVASVADGLKAWEILRARPNEIDLILTEGDLPSISGFALLTLIMEHEICKNIPVIMMSLHDSVNTVYNCMLRGAADYLVKPIRRNELKNLWQHVWRRQSQSTVGLNQPQIASKAEQKAEATSENNAACNDSSSCTGYAPRDCIEKGSDAQSSCTRREAESAHEENTQNIALSMEGKSFSGGSKVLNYETCFATGQKSLAHRCEAEEASPKDAKTPTPGMDANIASEASDNNDAIVHSCREAIDLIGAFNNHQSYNYKNASSANKFDSSPHLDLSLKRSNPSSYEVENEMTHMINHSNTSAFTLYSNRPFKRLHPTPASDCNQQSTDLSEQSDVRLSGSQQRVFPIPVPVREIKLNNTSTSYGPTLPSMFCAQSVPSPTPSPSSATHQEPTLRVSSFHQSNFENSNSEQWVDQPGQNNHTENKLDGELESLEECRNISHATDQSASSSFKNEEGLSAHGGNSNRSLQREAALTKFRLKRKERCFEKKVRYESRKKLAEQRPRVKGQFVRQVQTDLTPSESENQP